MRRFKIVFASFLLMMLGVKAVAQPASTRNYSKEADERWRAGAYSEAAEAFKLASEKVNPSNDKARHKKAYLAYMSATCYRLLHQHPAAEQEYEKAILLRYQEDEPIVYFHLAEMQMAQGKHDKAKTNYEKYLKLVPGDEIAKVRVESCEKYSSFMAKPSKHIVTNVTKLNTPSFDYCTVVDARGTEMYFSSSRQGSTGEVVDPITGENFMDIWMSTIDRNDNWGQPEPLPSPINTNDSEGTLAFDSRGKSMWFTRCPVLDKTNIGCEIWMVEKKGKSWGEPLKLELKDHDTTHVGHPAVSPEGDILIFSSNMAGGYGGTDLWYATYNKRDDAWSLPENLGPEINSSGNENFPTWGPEDRLYYSSNGRVGMGGLDIYYATKVKDQIKWEKPVNPGAPINSCRDDYHMIYTQFGKVEKGYFSSNRNGSKGENSQDIWDFYLPPVLVDVMILVSDQETGIPIPGAKVNLVGTDGNNYVLTTDASGQINLAEKGNGERYVEPGFTWTIEVEGVEKLYLPGHDAFSSVTEVNTRIIRDIKVLNIKKPIRLPEVRYDLAKASLQVNDSVNSKDSLNYLYDLMMENPTIIVELMAHTDCRGSDAANLKLSQQRADSCVSYLVHEKGIPPARLVPRGYGELVPLEHFEVGATGDTNKFTLKCDFITKYQRTDVQKFEHYHQLNRRTECRVLSMDYKEPEPGPKPEDGGGGGN